VNLTEHTENRKRSGIAAPREIFDALLCVKDLNAPPGFETLLIYCPIAALQHPGPDRPFSSMQLQSQANSQTSSPALSISPLVGLESVKTPKTILLVDDDDNFPLLLGIALRLLNPQPVLQHVPNAIQAKDYLRGELKFADRNTYRFPDLVLLDLRMPIMDGFEFLEWARSKSEFKKLDILVLTESINQRDLNRAYQLGATSFLVKSADNQDLAGRIKMLLQI